HGELADVFGFDECVEVAAVDGGVDASSFGAVGGCDACRHCVFELFAPDSQFQPPVGACEVGVAIAMADGWRGEGALGASSMGGGLSLAQGKGSAADDGIVGVVTSVVGGERVRRRG